MHLVVHCYDVRYVGLTFLTKNFGIIGFRKKFHNFFKIFLQLHFYLEKKTFLSGKINFFNGKLQIKGCDKI